MTVGAIDQTTVDSYDKVTAHQCISVDSHHHTHMSHHHTHMSHHHTGTQSLQCTNLQQTLELIASAKSPVLLRLKRGALGGGGGGGGRWPAPSDLVKESSGEGSRGEEEGGEQQGLIATIIEKKSSKVHLLLNHVFDSTLWGLQIQDRCHHTEGGASV